MNDAKKTPESWKQAEKPTLPAIQVNDVPLRAPGKLALAALVKHNDDPSIPWIYTRSGELVRLKRSESGELLIQDLSLDSLMGELADAADFVRMKNRGTPEFVFPPRDVVRYVFNRTRWAFPKLTGITTIPTLRSDGSILSERGYDPPTGLIYDPPAGFSVSVAESPTEKEVGEALRIIDDWIGQFPYADAASLAGTLALALTPVLREVITGPVPLAAIDKPAPGTGGSLLVECLAIATAGREPGALGVSADDDETRKQITSKLRTGERWIFLDNVSIELKAPSLARALTCGEWEDRILGVSKTVRVPQRAVWVATGNNLALSLEIARRSYWIRLDARVEHPWERDPKQFRHDKLKDWTRANRGMILEALLTLGRHWFALEQPVPENAPALGSFESWSAVLAGVLDTSGVKGFLANASALYERAIEDTGSWEAFLNAWLSTWGAERKATKEVAAALYGPHQDYGALQDALPDQFGLLDRDRRDPRLAQKLGSAFAKREGQSFGKDKLRLVRLGSKGRAVLWAVRFGEASDHAGQGGQGAPSLLRP